MRSVCDCVLHACGWLPSEQEITAATDDLAEVVACWEVTIRQASTKDTPFFVLTCWTAFSKIHLGQSLR